MSECVLALWVRNVCVWFMYGTNELILILFFFFVCHFQTLSIYAAACRAVLFPPFPMGTEDRLVVDEDSLLKMLRVAFRVDIPAHEKIVLSLRAGTEQNVY